MAGRYYEDFQVGQVIAHDIHRTVTETDNLLITTLTHNPAALHLDAEYCAGTEFGRVLVNSCFTLSLMIGVSVNDTTHRTAVANLGMDDVRFPKPVFVGDTLRIETEVQAVRPSGSRPNAGIVTFIHRAFNQGGEEVASCKRHALLLRRPVA
jgi:acyl dehydratase